MLRGGLEPGYLILDHRPLEPPNIPYVPLRFVPVSPSARLFLPNCSPLPLLTLTHSFPPASMP